MVLAGVPTGIIKANELASAAAKTGVIEVWAWLLAITTGITMLAQAVLLITSLNITTINAKISNPVKVVVSGRWVAIKSVAPDCINKLPKANPLPNSNNDDQSMVVAWLQFRARDLASFPGRMKSTSAAVRPATDARKLTQLPPTVELIVWLSRM